MKARFPMLTSDRHEWLQFPIMALYASLLYKQVVVGAALLLLCSAMTAVLLRERRTPTSVAAVLGIAYTALATVSAFFVSSSAGIERSAQFGLVLASAIVIAGLLHGLSPAAMHRFRIRFTMINIAVLFHVIIFHIMTKHPVTWKYLFDTKFVFSAIVVIVFLFEDRIRRDGVAIWFGALASTAALVLMSGERKAYVLLIAIFLLSRASLMSKALTLAVAVVLTLGFVTAMPQSYVARQLSSETKDLSRLSNRFFFTVDGIGRRSDYIRTFVNRNADLLFKEHPVLGTGATGYARWANEKYGSLRASRGLSMNVHGERHRVPAENGIVGIAVVLAFLAATVAAAVRFLWQRGGFKASSLARFPLYMTALLVSYIYGEAMDTTMLLLILLTGFAATATGPRQALRSPAQPPNAASAELQAPG
ncbi:MAG: O-antigen ligase family protein [Novosphingobium sp.]